MTISLRNERIRLYSYSDGGALGFVSKQFLFREERWCRLVETQSTEGTTGGVQAQLRWDAVAELADEATVNMSDLAIDPVTSDRYYVRGIVGKKSARCQLVSLQRIKPEEYETLVVSDGAQTGDGTVTAEGTETSIAES